MVPFTPPEKSTLSGQGRGSLLREIGPLPGGERLPESWWRTGGGDNLRKEGKEDGGPSRGQRALRQRIFLVPAARNSCVCGRTRVRLIAELGENHCQHPTSYGATEGDGPGCLLARPGYGLFSYLVRKLAPVCIILVTFLTAV
jgi:hypothetical protein